MDKTDNNPAEKRINFKQIFQVRPLRGLLPAADTLISQIHDGTYTGLRYKYRGHRLSSVSFQKRWEERR